MLEHVGKLLAEPQTNMLVFYNLSLGCTAVLSRMTTVIGSSIGFNSSCACKKIFDKGQSLLNTVRKNNNKNKEIVSKCTPLLHGFDNN